MKITTIAELKDQIRLLEKRNHLLEEQLKTRIKETGESLKPANLVKDLLPSVFQVPGVKSNLLGAAISLGLGFLTNRFLIGRSGGVLKKIAGAVLQVGLGGVVAKKLPILKNLAANLFSRRNGT